MSHAKSHWNRLYRESKKSRMAAQIIERGYTFCQRCEKPCDPDGAHVNGQNGARILVYFLLCRPCHTWCEDHKTLARSEGWMAK